MDRTEDLAALHRVIADIEAGFNANDPELLVAHFTEGGTAVDVRGRLLAGREAMLAAARTGLAGPLRDQFARYELGDVTFLGDDVALAHKRATATTADGAPLDVGHAMIALYVFVREDGAWRVAARQNTLTGS
jgi:uncharacterized protein (TIGR02246 family)